MAFVLRVRLAGGLRLESDGREIVPPRSRRARALLAYVAAHPGPHARAQLAARFWPDVLDESARTSLRAALTELRGALGDEAEHLVATRAAIELDAEVAVDVRAFTSLLAAGRLEEGLVACEGELLAGMDDDWVHDLRRERAGQAALALDELAARAEERGDLDAARRLARDAAARDALLEAPRRRLERLAAAETDRVVADIPPPIALGRAAEGDFVGRAQELARLEAVWRDVLASRSRRLVLLAGEAGIGKTSLALRFAAAAEATVLLGRCSEDPLASYEPFAEILRQIGEARAAALAGASAAELGRLTGATGSAEGADLGARHRLFSAVDDAIGTLAARRPLVLVIDDLHWADRPTLLLLAFLLRSGRSAPLLAVGTYRDTEVGRSTPLAASLPELRRDGAAQRIGLRGLDAPEVAELAAAWLGPDAAAQMAPAVHARTAGNAFFVGEVLRGIAEHAAGVPESVRHAVGTRLARLSPAADELLAVAAVLGERVDPQLLDRMVPGAEEPLEELLAASLLRPGVEFTHALVREAVIADLNPLRHGRLHRAAADALVADGEDRHLEQIAYHLAEARDPRAGAYLRRAGERALAMLAYEEAARHFAHALEAGEPAGPLLLARGDALLRAGEPAAARECFRAAAALARERSDAVLLARAALGHAGLGIAIIDLDEPAIALLEEALDALGDDDPVLRSELLARLAVELYYAPNRDRSEQLSAQAVAAARAGGDQRAVAAALNARHVALWRPDRLEERLAAADEMIAVARAAGERALELQGRNWRVVDLFERFDLDEWRAELRRHAALADELRLPAFQWYTPLWEAVDAVHCGRYEEGRPPARARPGARGAGRRPQRRPVRTDAPVRRGRAARGLGRLRRRADRGEDRDVALRAVLALRARLHAGGDGGSRRRAGAPGGGGRE